MEQGGLGTVQWRAAFDLFEQWQAAAPEARPACLAGLCQQHPQLADSLHALVRADAAATGDAGGLSLVLGDALHGFFRLDLAGVFQRRSRA